MEYLRATGSPVHQMVKGLLCEDSFTTDVVVAELLMGARDELHAEKLRAMLNRCHFVPTRPLFDFEQAAAVYRACRRGGFTPRSMATAATRQSVSERGVKPPRRQAR